MDFKLENLKLVGKGNTAEVYEFEENKVLKLFRQGMGQ